MRFMCVVLLLVVLLLVPETDALWRRRRRRRRRWFRRALRGLGRIIRNGARIAWNGAKEAIKGATIGDLGKRDLMTLDLNNDGLIDQSELENFTSEEKEARALLDLIDDDGDARVTPEELDRGLRELAMMNEDEFIDDADVLQEEDMVAE